MFLSLSYTVIYSILCNTGKSTRSKVYASDTNTSKQTLMTSMTQLRSNPGPLCWAPFPEDNFIV